MSSSIDLQPDRPHSARIYDFLLGGKDNFEADRIAAATMLEHTPGLATSMRANRRFMSRVAAHLATTGIRQFLDVGTGLPTHPNLHETVQDLTPDASVVYVDNDPLVLAHARALLTPAGTGRIAYLDADLRRPEEILQAPEVTAFDLSRPVALTLIAVLQHITDDDQAIDLIARLTRPLPLGSAIAISAVTVENDPDGGPGTVRTYNQNGVPVVARNRAGVEALLTGFTLIEPGVVPVHHWRPGPDDHQVNDKDVYMYGGVAIKR